MSRSTLRTAAKSHRCMSCDRSIGAGERYWRWVTFPSDGIFDRIASGAECSTCAARYGRPVDSGGIEGGYLLALAVILAVVLVYVAAGGAR